MVGADAPVDRTGSDIGLDFLVQLEVVLLGKDVNLGAGGLLPFADTRIERFILLAANELGVDRHAFKLARQIGCNRRGHPHGHQRHACQNARFEILHLFSS